MARLDTYLKNTGLIKQRGEAKRACSNGQVQVNGTLAKPGREVRVGEVITLETDTAFVEAEVLGIPQRPAPKSQRETFYRILRREARDPLDDLSF